MALNTGLFNIAPGESSKDVDMRRRLAAQLILQGSSTEPVQAWTQGAARLAQALMGGHELRLADQEDAKKEAALRSIGDVLTGRQGGDAPMAPPSMSPQAPQAPPMLPSPAPGGGQVTPPAPQAPVRQAMEGTLPADVPYEAGGMPQRPPQAAINSAINQTPGTPGGPQPTPPPGRSAPPIPPEVQKQFSALWANPETRPIALQIIAPYWQPKEQFQEVNGPGGTPIAQKNLATGELKAHPNSDYMIHNREDGAIIAVNKSNPKDFHIIQPPGAAKDLATYKGDVKRAEDVGTAQGQAQVNLGPSVDTAQRALDNIQQIRDHPGKQYGVGVLGVVPGVPGTSQRGFVNLVDQAKSGSFLTAYQTLRGGGQISNAEGSKAEQALQRLDRAQRQEDFDKALNDFESVIKIGQERARKQAVAIPSEQTATGGVRKYNPTTGKIE